MPNHSPGPWVFDETSESIIDSDGDWVAHCDTRNKSANIRLILAAPDLLAACEEFLEAKDFFDEHDARVAIQDAVSKATGIVLH